MTQMTPQNESHSTVFGYVLWLIGFVGAHRFYFGKQVSGLIWALTGGLCGIGWLVDLFLIPSMEEETRYRYQAGHVDYTLAWLFLLLFGWLGIHRFYMGKVGTGVLYLLTGGLLGIGWLVDVFTLNEQANELNSQSASPY